ncbi:MAG: hypothetical protein MR283_06805 [Erysipelotrichaceae bacterium]|nr:hypothetical protein [Erysipelotrichaceae bacterium]MDY6035462.1 hypothetical protein [Bulleidia sp.]
MEKFAIVTRYDETSKSIGEKIKETLTQKGYVFSEESPETVFVVGGDGTYIEAIHQYLDLIPNVKFLGLHTGTLGFFTEYQDNELDDLLQMYMSNEYKVLEFPLLAVQAGDKVYHAVNEVRVENVSRTQVLDVYLSGEYLERFRGTGMCVCTQLGSTAYNRSLGGAVIQDGLDLIELTEIAGIHHSKYRSLYAPLILKKETEVVLKSESFCKAILGVDANTYTLDQEQELKIKVCDCKHVRMIKGKSISYFKKLSTLF